MAFWVAILFLRSFGLTQKNQKVKICATLYAGPSLNLSTGEIRNTRSSPHEAERLLAGKSSHHALPVNILSK